MPGVGAERLAHLLDAARGVDEWIATETRVRQVVQETGGRRSRSARETATLGAVVFRDSDQGRGTARLWLDAGSGDEGRVRALIASAVERAGLAVGPAWVLPAPAAPARVVVADPDVAVDPGTAVDSALAQLGKAHGRLASVARARIDAESRSHRAVTSRGFASAFESTSIGFDVDVGVLSGSGTVLEACRGRVRSVRQLFLHRRVADAARTIARRMQVRSVEPGRYDLLLRPAAIAGPLAELDPTAAGPAGFGWLAPLVAHAGGEWLRLGLSRHRPGQPVFRPGPYSGPTSSAPEGPRAARLDPRRPPAGGEEPGGVFDEGDRLTLVSDGTLDLAPLSAPFAELGEPVRRFDIVRAGIAAGLALDHREAALARTTPNGGVRNLVLAAGPTPATGLAGPGQHRLLEIDQLGWLDVDPRTGALTAEVRLGQVGATAVAGCLVIGNAFDLLARAHLSSETATLGWYRGPAAIRIDGVDVAAV